MTNSDDKAFPVSGTVGKLIHEGYVFPEEFLGLTKLEYFTAAALTGLLAQGRGTSDASELAVTAAEKTIQILNNGH